MWSGRCARWWWVPFGLAWATFKLFGVVSEPVRGEIGAEFYDRLTRMPRLGEVSVESSGGDPRWGFTAAIGSWMRSWELRLRERRRAPLLVWTGCANAIVSET
jgi:hypothetical protein